MGNSIRLEWHAIYFINVNHKPSSIMPLSNAAPLSPHLVNASREINVTDEINKSILANKVTPIVLASLVQIMLFTSPHLECHITLLLEKFCKEIKHRIGYKVWLKKNAECCVLHSLPLKLIISCMRSINFVHRDHQATLFSSSLNLQLSYLCFSHHRYRWSKLINSWVEFIRSWQSWSSNDTKRVCVWKLV